MKQLEKTQVSIGDSEFYISPFPAFKAANISGKVVALVGPVLTVLLSSADTNSSENILDQPVEKLLPSLTAAFAGLEGDNLEKMLKELLTDNKNISFETPESEKVAILNESSANELFCQDIESMYLLAWEVIKVNYGGFFKKASTRYGDALTGLAKTGTGKSTASLTTTGSAS